MWTDGDDRKLLFSPLFSLSLFQMEIPRVSSTYKCVERKKKLWTWDLEQISANITTRQCQGSLEPQSEITTTTIQKRERRKGKKQILCPILILRSSRILFWSLTLSGGGVTVCSTLYVVQTVVDIKKIHVVTLMLPNANGDGARLRSSSSIPCAHVHGPAQCFDAVNSLLMTPVAADKYKRTPSRCSTYVYSAWARKRNLYKAQRNLCCCAYHHVLHVVVLYTHICIYIGPISNASSFPSGYTTNKIDFFFLFGFLRAHPNSWSRLVFQSRKWNKKEKKKLYTHRELKSTRTALWSFYSL
jgi:hypothetical protein